MRSPLAILWSLLMLAQAALWWRGVAWYPSIPDRFPIHFDMAGNPDGWATKSLGAWFLLPVFGTVVSVGLAIFAGLALPRLARHTPTMINLPHKERFLALDPERRVQAVSPVACFLVYVAIATTALFVWILETTARVATGLQGPTPPWPVGVFLVLVVGGIVGMTLALHRRLASLEVTVATTTDERS